MNHEASKKNSYFLPNFLCKLWEVLENESLDYIIGWNQQGTSFIVKNVHLFCLDVLPVYFKHQNFTSFVRQLNMYDFHKVKTCKKVNEFLHPYFQRNQKAQLKNIRRKKSFLEQNLKSELIVEDSQQGNEKQFLQEEIVELRMKQENLEEVCSILISQNTQLQKQNKLLYIELQKAKIQKDKKINSNMIQKQISQLIEESNKNQVYEGQEQIEEEEKCMNPEMDMNQVDIDEFFA